jgi:hypothetical protein
MALSYNDYLNWHRPERTCQLSSKRWHPAKDNDECDDPKYKREKEEEKEK